MNDTSTEEMQEQLDQARADFHKAIRSKIEAHIDAAWASYMQVYTAVFHYNREHGTKIKPTF